MWRTSRTAPMPINARSTAWAARRWPAPADADSTNTLPSSATFFPRCEILVSVRPFSDCNEPGPESEDKRRTVNGCALAPPGAIRPTDTTSGILRTCAFRGTSSECGTQPLTGVQSCGQGTLDIRALQHTRVSFRGTQLSYPEFLSELLTRSPNPPWYRPPAVPGFLFSGLREVVWVILWSGSPRKLCMV